MFPGYWYINPRHKIKLSAQLEADLMECRNGLTWDNTIKLRSQMFWLAVAQQEIDCWPILLVCSCLGPVVLFFRRGRNEFRASLPPTNEQHDQKSPPHLLNEDSVENLDISSVHAVEVDPLNERNKQE